MHQPSRGRGGKGQSYKKTAARPQNRRSGSGSFSRGGQRGGGAKHKTFSDVSKFINKISVTEEQEVFVPEHAFTDFDIQERLKHNITHKGYVSPTPIQDRTIPHILKGEDVVGIANTGTGKTAAFLIPLINKVLKKKSERILVVVPTRELATQIEAEFLVFAKNLHMFSVCVVGGTSIMPQLRALKRRPSFVIGTPGRIKDLIERDAIRLGEFGTVVLDEADRMLDMGFINDIKYMMNLMPEERHTLFFSATVSSEITALINTFLKHPVTISVKTRDTSRAIDQDVVRVARGEEKIDRLRALLQSKDFSKVLIFGKTKHGVEKLSVALMKMGFKVESIHGNKNHGKRQRALGQFKNNEINILVATDVAARGLDIADVSHVINYDLPATYEDYIHRIGRTGRAGKQGKALTFIAD